MFGWKPEVQVVGEGDKWHRNGLVFATRKEALGNARNLFERWSLALAYRAVKVDDPPNYRWTDAGLVLLGSKQG